MFIYSVKGSSLKFFGVVFACVVILVALIALIPSGASADSSVYAGESTVDYSDIETNEDRINFLKQFGWEVESEPAEEEDVTIPSEFDKVFVNYNQIQKQQGLDLSKYRRKNVTRFTYIVTNYPNYDGTVYANILVYRGNVIGGDICSADVSGFVYGFSGK